MEQEPWRRNYVLIKPCPFKGAPRYVAGFNSVEGRIRTQLYIDYGDAQANGALFLFLYESRDEIESTYGSALEWAELPGREPAGLGITDSVMSQLSRTTMRILIGFSTMGLGSAML